jgi:flavine halogenase
MNEKLYRAKSQMPLPTSPFASSSVPYPVDSTVVACYLSNLSCAPGVVKLITSAGTLNVGSVKSASDFSYSSPSYAGNGYRIVGDAGGKKSHTSTVFSDIDNKSAFIDPFFSSGVHLAMTSALSAAATICASIRNHCHESQAADWHTRRVSTSYTRY